MVGVQSVVDGLIRTFGPFLIPVTVFGIGFVGYAILFMLNRQFRDDEEGGVVNLSAGTPEPSTTDKDHGATGRGVLPEDMSDEFSPQQATGRENGPSPPTADGPDEVEADKWTTEAVDPGEHAPNGGNGAAGDGEDDTEDDDQTRHND